MPSPTCTRTAGSSADGGIEYLYQLYSRAKPDYTGRVTVPVLWDEQEQRIVNNESSEIIRMLNRDFDALARRKLADLYPEKLKKEIDWLNERIYRTVNNGVYRAGFATAQDKYEEAVTGVFKTLDWLERRFAKRTWLCGKAFTEADVRLFTTLVRFDAVYYSHFKCNLRRLVDYPRLWRWTRRVYALPGVAKTVDMKQIKLHYYRSMKHINPTQIVPKGPLLDFRLLVAFAATALTPPAIRSTACSRRAKPGSARPTASRARRTSAGGARQRLPADPLLRRGALLPERPIGRRGALRARARCSSKRRFEGFPSDEVPTSMVGPGRRAPGADVGIAAHKLGAGVAYGELMTEREPRPTAASCAWAIATKAGGTAASAGGPTPRSRGATRSSTTSTTACRATSRAPASTSSSARSPPTASPPAGSCSPASR